MKKIILSLCVLSMSSYYNVAVAGNTHNNSQDLDTSLRKIINQQGLTGNPLLNRTVPNISDPKPQLGMDLFFSKTLGGDQDSACVACHHPALGGGDQLALPVGVEADDPDLLGPGRTNDGALNNPEGGPPVPRNAPTTFNVVAWDKFQFHDGRVESLDKIPGANGAGASGIRTPDSALNVADPLAGNNLVHAQARFPVTSNEEMKGFDHADYTGQTIRELLAGRLGGYGDDKKLVADLNHWLEKFQEALPELPNASVKKLINEQNVSMLIAEYERSQAFVETPWKEYVEGNMQAISTDAKQGALLFYSSSENGGANCSSCHSGDFFTDEGFHNIAMPQIGPGKGDGEDGSKDFGRARETGMTEDKFAFRTPSLINVEVTGPWSHAGAYSTLEAVVNHHIDTTSAVNNYDESQLSQFGIRNLEKVFENTKEALNEENFALEPLAISNKQVGYIVEFLKSLTDPCTQDRECLGKWIPDPEFRNDPNGDQLNAIDTDGNLL